MTHDDFDLRDLPEPGPEAYELVRRRVLGNIRRRKQMETALRTVAATAACLLVVWGLSFCLRRDGTAPVLPLVAFQPPAPALTEPPPIPVPVRKVVHRRKPRRREGPLFARADVPFHRQPLLVKMQTDDPGVVILWLVD